MKYTFAALIYSIFSLKCAVATPNDSINCQTIENQNLYCTYESQNDLDIFDSRPRLHQIQRLPVFRKSLYGSIALIKDISISGDHYPACWILNLYQLKHVYCESTEHSIEIPDLILELL